MANTLQLTIFSDFTPDSDGGNFYFPASSNTKGKAFNVKLLERMKTELTNYKDLAGTTFHIFGNYIDLGGINISPIEVWNITYCAITLNGYPMFYYVDNVQPISTGIRLFIRMDYWASYIGSASITNVEFFKSNLLLSGTDKNENTIYTTTEQPARDAANTGIQATQIAELSNISISNLKFYAVIKHHTINNWTTQIEEIHLYKFDPVKYLISVGITTPPTTAQFIAIMKYVASIYEVQAQGFTGKGNAELLKLYIFPDILTTTGTTRKFYGSTPEIASLEWFAGEEVAIQQKTYTEWISNAPFGLGYNSVHNPVELNTVSGQIIFGTQFNGLKLSTIVGESETLFRIIVSQDSIQFQVEHITAMRDITESFTVAVVANTGTLTSQERTAKWLGVIANAVGAGAQIAAGGAGAVSGALQLGQTFNNLSERRNGNYVAAGDGLNTFYPILYAGSKSFLFYRKQTTDLRQAVDRIYEYGAITHYNLTESRELADHLPDCKFLLNDPVNKQLPYISAQATVDNIPYAASAAISEQLLKGVRLIYV